MTSSSTGSGSAAFGGLPPGGGGRCGTAATVLADLAARAGGGLAAWRTLAAFERAFEFAIADSSPVMLAVTVRSQS